MLYYYSAVKNAFFPDELKGAYQNAGNWPQDATEVEESVFTTYSAPPPEGKQRAAGKDGLPCWVDIPLPDIEDVRNRKHDEINAWRNIQENANYTFTFNNRNWDYGRTTQERLSLSVQMAKANKLPAGFTWTDADNTDIPMTAGELLNFSDATDQAMFTKGLEIHMRQRAMKEELNRLTTVKATLAYSVGWPPEGETHND